MVDLELLDLLRNRHPEGVEALTKKYGPLIRYVIAPILEDYREQEECMADVLYRIWDKIDMYDEGKGSLSTWISTMTRNMAYNRAKSNERRCLYEEISEDLVSDDNGPEEEILRQEQLESLRTALDSLSVRDRQLIYRKYFYMQSTEQIAAEMGFAVRAVEGRLYRIKKKLRGRFHE